MIKIFPNKLDAKEETALKTHKYKAVDKSILSRFVFRRYTSYLLKFVPTTCPPNTLTMLGYVVMLLNFIIVIVVDPSLKRGTPLLSLISSICLLIYFTADNLDGAQARKINEMSPLGQMFDHGVDSCCVFFCMVALISSLGLGLTYTSLGLISCVMSGFYLSGLEEKYTGIFEFGVISGPTEGLVVVFSLHLLSCFYKPYLNKILGWLTLSPYLIKKLNFPNLSPFFFAIILVIMHSAINSYFKCIGLSNLKKKQSIFVSFFRLFLVFIPLFVLHKRFMASLNLQIVNMLIFSQSFSLNYIEEVFSNIAKISKRRWNLIFKLYILWTAIGSFIDPETLSYYSIYFLVYLPSTTSIMLFL